jgi:hypothetical protein
MMIDASSLREKSIELKAFGNPSIATVKETERRLRIGILLLRARELGIHEAWKDPVCGHHFDKLVDAGLMETRPGCCEECPERRLTPRGLAVLIKLLDSLALEAL